MRRAGDRQTFATQPLFTSEHISMRIKLLMLLLIAVCFSMLGSVARAEAPAPGKQVAAETTVKVKSEEAERNVTLRYLFYLPSEYDVKSAEKWPLVLFI